MAAPLLERNRKLRAVAVFDSPVQVDGRFVVVDTEIGDLRLDGRPPEFRPTIVLRGLKHLEVGAAVRPGASMPRKRARGSARPSGEAGSRSGPARSP